MALPINKLIDNRYIITKLIGSGGMAEIYEANDTFTHKKVAIKIIKDQFEDDLFELERFETEARLVSAFNHPHIVKIFNIGTYEHKMFISYELATGKTLLEYLDNRSHLSKEEAVEYILQILSATKHIHERGIIHNDLKPGNMVKSFDGNIKLLDFGIASHLGDNFKDKVVASIQYAAPEVLTSKAYSIQSDIYSLGIILFELLTGRTPFMKPTADEEIKAHQFEEIPSISNFVNVNNYQDFDFVIKKATNINLKNRYKSDDEMIADINKIKKGLPLKEKTFLERLFGR